MIVTDLFESAPGVAEALGDNRPKLGSKRDQGKSVRQWRRDRGMDESGMAEYSLNELSSDLLQKSAQVAKNKSRQAMDPNIHDALGGGYTNPLAKHYDSLSQKFNDRAAKVGQRDAVKKIASPAVMRKIGMTEQGMAESPTDDPRFQKMMGNIQKSTPAPVSGYVALNFASEQRSKKIKGVSQNGKPMPDVIDNPEEFLSGKIEFTPDQVEKQLTAIGKKYGWDSIDSGQGQGYTEMFFDTSKEYTSNNQNLLAANIANTVNAINKFFNGMNNSLQATGLPGYKTDVWQGMGPPNDTNQIGDLSQIANIAKGKSAKSDPGAAIGKMILKYIPSYEADDELGYDPEDFASALAIAKVYIAQGEKAGLQAQLNAQGHVGDMIDELLSDAGGSGLRTIWDLEEQGMAESHGNYAGDTPVNLGGVSMKMIQAGDTVQYIDQTAQVVDMSPDRKYSRITIPSSSTTKTVLTSDLRQLGQGMRESDDEQLDELGWKDLGSKIFGSSPNTTAAPGSLSPRFSAHIPNPATRKPYTQSELRALAAKKATAAAAEPAASAAPIPATPKAVQTKKSSSDSFTPDEISRMTPFYQKQLAGITEALAQPVAEMLQMVETKEDVQRIKKFIDDTFVKHGAVNESAFVVRNQILEHVTQVGAQRRRDFAAQQTH